MISRFSNPPAGRDRLGRLAVSVVIFAAVSALGDDRVVRLDGDQVRGSIVSLSPDAVELEDRGGVEKISVADVREVVFDGEPMSLASARTLMLRGDPAGAIGELEKLEAAEIDAAEPRIREEYAFLKAATAAQAATAADGPAAAAALARFLAGNLRSHHLYEGHEILGDLFARLGKFDDATKAYGELERGPPALRVRSAASKARVLMQRGKPADAIKEFEAAIGVSTDPGDDASNVQKGEAALGLARCLARTGKAGEGIAAARAAIRTADVGDRQLLAKAFAALGECQRAAGGKDEDALISFLTVDLVYNTVADARAEALYNLGELWDSIKQPERAREARQALLTTYPDTPWAKKLGGGNAS